MWVVCSAVVAAVSVLVAGVVYCLPCKLTLSLGSKKLSVSMGAFRQ